MSYTVQVVAALAAVGLVDLRVLRTRLLLRRSFWVAYAIMAGCQLVMNGILTGLPVVTYERTSILGLRIASAPVEDLAFGFALILLTLSCWIAAGRARPARPARQDAGHTPAPTDHL